MSLGRRQRLQQRGSAAGIALDECQTANHIVARGVAMPADSQSSDGRRGWGLSHAGLGAVQPRSGAPQRDERFDGPVSTGRSHHQRIEAAVVAVLECAGQRSSQRRAEDIFPKAMAARPLQAHDRFFIFATLEVDKAELEREFRRETSGLVETGEVVLGFGAVVRLQRRPPEFQIRPLQMGRQRGHPSQVALATESMRGFDRNVEACVLAK
jgi:hypothetical protein